MYCINKDNDNFINDKNGNIVAIIEDRDHIEPLTKILNTHDKLMEMVEQYSSDVQGRISALISERDNNRDARLNPEIYDLYQDQIDHWKATRKQIEQVLNENE